LLVLNVVRRFVWSQMLPQAVVTPFKFVVQALAALALDQAFPGTAFFDNDDPEFWVYFSIAVPVATGRANLDFGGENKLFAHGLLM